MLAPLSGGGHPKLGTFKQASTGRRPTSRLRRRARLETTLARSPPLESLECKPSAGNQRAPDGAALRYERHRPRAAHAVPPGAAARGQIAQTEASTGAELPRFISDEFNAFLECGILAHGFLRSRCGECGHDSTFGPSVADDAASARTSY
jgi:hypothetical protein